MYKVKVLIATYNGEVYLEEQINSILQQRNVDLNLFLSDDLSSDNTIEIVKSKFPNLKYKVNIPPSGSAANNFLSMIKSLDFSEEFDFVAFADQDDIWLPNKLNEAIIKLNSQSANLYCSNLIKWDEKSGELSLLKKDFPQKEFDYLFEGGSAGCTYVFRKSFAEAFRDYIKLVDSQDWQDFSHDWLIYFFARNKKYKVIIDSVPNINYRIHNNNVHGHLNKLSLKSVFAKTEKVLQGYYIKQAVNYIKLLEKNSEEFRIYDLFTSNYCFRNYVIWKYNFKLMRSKRKFFQFALLNLLSFKN